jgi:hypothetical protein
MLRAGDTLFVAGPAAEMVERTQPASGRQGALLMAYSAKDGAELRRYELAAPPVLDGMAAARGRLFVALADGSMTCLGASKK